MIRFFGSSAGAGPEGPFDGDPGRPPSSGSREFPLTGPGIKDVSGQAVTHAGVELIVHEQEDSGATEQASQLQVMQQPAKARPERRATPAQLSTPRHVLMKRVLEQVRSRRAA